MVLDNIRVSDMEESILASGYPMSVEITQRDLEEKDFKRIKKLIELSRLHNPAHGQWLTGVRVSFDLTFSNKAWVEAERYRFLEFVSSQSTMHRVSQFDIGKQCNKYVDYRIIEIVEELKQKYLNDKTAENYLILLYNLPNGFQITARMTTNYRCLLNIYIQRYDHRLPEWREFCEEIKKLPYFEEFLEMYYPGFLTKK